MNEVIEDLLSTSGGDGDFIKGFSRTTIDPAEIKGLLDAWSEERGRHIESLWLLRRVHRLLSRTLVAGRLTDQSMREMKRLLHLIESVESDLPETES